MTLPTDQRIPLRHGPDVLEHVVLWLLAAADRGLQFRVEGDRIHLKPRRLVTAADRAFIDTDRADLLLCLAYVDQVCADHDKNA